jgi:filamentous hemagglutinin
MNKLRYRIVFNKTRGMCMAVPETARSHTQGPGQGAAGSSASGVMRIPRLRRMAFMLGVGLAGAAFADGALAQVVADPNAPGSQRATVLNAANGVVQVNIQTPSAAGVSRNVYSQFDVPKSGAILNNSRTNVQTQLGGWVQGNPWLATGTARVILNEVNSSNPSRLQGYIEVAGDRAETIIANPAGIVVDGGGFINVSRATLTTGSPMLEDGRLKGYSVQRGQIIIDGAGLDASKTDYTALIARSLQVNAGLWAQRLNVITGVNEVEEAAQAAVTHTGQAADAPPLYAVDVARLGGMYANQIYLVGTEAGVGVRNAGAIGAAAGDLVVTASGRLENSGTLSATRAMQARAAGIENQGLMQAGETLELTATSMVNAGQLASGREALIAVQGEIDNSHGRIEATRIDLTAAKLSNNQGSIVQTGAQEIAIEAVDVINTAGTLGQQSVATATDTTTTVDGNAGSPAGAGASGGTGSVPGQTTAQDGTSADTGLPSTSTPAPILADGRLQVGLLDNTSGVITANGEAVLRTGGLDNRGGQTFLGSLVVSGSTFDNTGGALTVLRTFDAQTERFINDQGTLLVGAAFSGALGAFSNRQGLLQAPHLSVNVTGQLDNSGGTLRHFGTAATALVVGGELALDKGVLDTAGALRLQVGAISGSGSTVNVAGDFVVDSGVTSVAQGRWTIGGSAILHAGALDNSGGAIHVGQSLDLVSGALTNANGTIVADADASISAYGTVDNSGGAIQAAHDLALKSSDVILNRAGSIGALANTSTLSVAGAVIDNDDGRIVNAGTGRTVLTADSISSRGLIGGNGDVGLTTHTLHNEVGGAVASQGNLELVVDAALANRGRLDAGGHLRMVQDAAQLSNSGIMAAQGGIEIAVASVDNSLGILATVAGSGSRLLLTADSLANQAGAIQADGAATIAIQGGVGNEGGHIRAGADLSLDAAGRIENHAGSIESAERLQLHGTDIGNDGGRIAAAGTQTSVIEADRIIDNNGLIGANGQLMLRTQTLDSGVAGTISSVGDLELAVSSGLANRGGSINTAGRLNFDQRQATLVNSGALTAGAGVRLNIDQIDNRGGSINSLQGAGLELHANMLDNQGGRLIAGSDASVQLGRDADNSAGVMQAAGSLSVAVGGTLHNQDGAIEALGEHGSLGVHATTIDNTAGRIISVGDGTVNLSAAGHIGSSGLIAGNGRLALSAASLGNAGTISSGGGLYAGQPNMALRNSGIIVAGGLLEMALGTIDNAGGRIATAQGSGADLLLTAQSISNQGGAITGDRDLTLIVAKDVDGRAGLVQARGGLQLNAGGLVDVSGGGIETLSTNSSLQLHAGAVLNDAGRIVNAGSGYTRVRVDTTLVNNGEIAGNGVLGVEAQSVRNQAGGSVVAAGALTLQAHAALDNAGTISSGAGLTMDEGDAALSNHGTILAAGDIALRAGAIDNNGGTLATANGSGAGLLLDAASVSNRGGAILSDRDAQVSSAAAFDNTGGALQAAGSLRLSAAGAADNHGGVIETLGPDATLSVHAGLLDNGSGRIVNVGRGATSVTVDGRLASHGLVAGNGRLDVAVGELDNQADGSIVSGNTLRIDATQGIGNAGAISSQGALTLDATYGSVANHGTIVAGAGARIDAARFDNDGGQLVTTAGGHGDIRLDSGDMSNVGGTVMADGALRISAGGTIDNRQGTVRANTALAINAAGALGNQDGVIEAADASAILDVRARSIDNSAGRLANVGHGATGIMATDDIINSGTLAGNGSVSLSASSLRNQVSGTIGAGAALDLNVTQELDNAGRISAGAALNMDQAGARIANSGGMVAAGALALHAAAIANDGGQITTLSGAGIVLSSESTLSNRAGLIAAAGDASLGAQGAFDNTQGQVQTPGHLGVSVDGVLTNAGGTLETVGAASTLTLHAASIGNTAGRIVNAGSGQTSVDSTSDIVNSGTIGGNGALTISAQNVQNASDGTIVAGTTLDLALSEQIGNAGAISSGEALHADLGAGTFKNSGRIDAAGDISIAAGSLDNTGGTVSADGLLRVAAGDSVSNDGGTLHGGTGATLDAGARLANGSGTIETASGSLALQARSIGSSGHIVNAGTGATALLATDAIVNSGTIAGNGALVLAGQTLRNADSGVIGSGADFKLAVRQQLDNAGTLSSGGTLRFDQGAAEFGNSGRIGARGSIDITAATIGNEGGELYTVGQSGTAITMRAQRLDNIGGTVSADGLLRVETADGVANSGGNLHGGTGVVLSVAGSLQNGSGTIESAAGALDIQVGSIDSSGRIVNAGTGQTTIATTMDIVNSGTIGGNGALALSAQALQNTSGGTIASGAAMDLAVRRQLDNAGRISSGTSLHVGQAATSLSNTGRIEAGGPIDITAATLANRGGQLYTVAGSDAAVNLGTGSLDNTGGTISADGVLRAAVAGGIANDGGSLHGGTGATLQAGGVLANGGGVIESADSALDIRARSIDSSGRIVNAGTGETTITSSTDLVNGGTIAVNGKLALSAQAMANSGAISAGSAIDITAATASNRGGQLYTASQSGAVIQVNAGSLDNTDGTVSADGLLAVVASEAIANGGGTLHGGTGVVVDAGAVLTNGSGTIESAAGTLDIQAGAIESSGRIVNAGTGQTTIGSATGIVNAGTFAGNGALGIVAASLRNTGSGTIGSGAGLELAMREWLENAGTISSAGTLRFDQAAASFGNTGRVGAAGSIDITAATLANRGGQLYTVNGAGASIRLQAGSLDNSGGTVSADSLLRAEVAGAVANDGGTLHGGTGTTLVASGALSNGSGTIEGAAGALELHAAAVDSSGRIVNAGTGATTIGSATSIMNGGTIAGNGALTLAAQTLENTGGGTIGSGADLELAVHQRLDNAGTISSAGTLHFDQTAASFGNSGTIGAGGNIAVTAAAVNNRGGQLYTLSGSGAAIDLHTGSLDNTAGTVSADGLLRANLVDGIVNSGGTLHGGSSVRLHGGGMLANGSGTIEAAAGELEVTAQSIESSGRIVNAGIGQTSIGSTTSIVNAGTIAGNGALALSAETLQNASSGAVGSGAGLELAVSQRLENAGAINSGANLNFGQAAASFANTGSIGAAGAIDITAASIANRGGQLVTAGGSGAAITLATASLDNMGGTASADGLLGVLVSGNTVNSGGTLHGGTGTLLNAGGTLANASGTIEAAAGTLQLQATSIDNLAGRIVNAGSGATSIDSATDIDNSGTIAGNGELMLSARTLRNTGSGVLSSGTAMALVVGQQLLNAGSIGSGGSMHVGQAAARFENTGRIGAGGSIDITAATIDNVGGQIYTSKGSGASIGLHTGGLDNSGGTVAADGMLLAQVGGGAVNSGGVLHAGTAAALDVSGALANGSGTIATASGTLEIHAASVDSSGRIVNAGTGGTRIDSTTSIVNSGTIAGNGTLAVAAETLQNAAGGAIGTGSGAALELAARQELANAGTISSGSTLQVGQAAANLINNGRIGAASNIDITAATVDNAGGQLYTVSQSGAAIGLRTGSLDNTGGTIAADGLLGIEAAGDVANNAGILHGGAGTALDTDGVLANGSGTIEALSGALQIKARSIDSSGRIVNGGAGATSIASIGAILNGGTIGGNGTLDLHASALQNQGGQIMSAGELLLDVRQMLLNTGTISSGGTLTFNQAGASFANSGQIAAAGDIRLTAASFDNDGGRISTVRGSGGDVTLSASSLSNRGGAIMADGDAILSIAGPVDNSHGVLQAGANLTLNTNGNIGNDGGVIEALGGGSTLSLEGAAIDNGSGQISNAGSGDTRLLAQVSINNGGAIAGMGNLLLSGQTLANAAGATLASGSNLTLAVSQQLGNQGKVNSAGMLTFDQAAAMFTNSGEVYSGANAVIHASAVNNDGGRLGTGSGTDASLALTSQLLSNQGGRIATDGDLVVDTHTVSALGELFGGRDLALSMDGDFVQSGVQQLRSNRNLSLSVTGSIHNFSTLETAGTLTLSGQDISNRVGASIEGRSVVLRTSGNLSNGGEINGQDTLDISAATVGNTSGMVGGNVTLATGRLDNVGSAALIGATETLGLNVAGALYNTGGATLYSSGDILIGGQYGGSAEEVHNISSTIEAAGNLTLNAGSLSNVRENVRIVQVKTVDETVHMTMPSWFQYGDNHNSFETSAANYRPHEVYFVSPSDILEDEVYWTPDGNKIHRALIRTHANDSAFQVASTGLYSAYGKQSRLTLSEGTRVIYYTESAQVANPDQGGAASNAVVYANSVTNWSSTVSFSNQYGNCSSDCIRLITQPGYTDPRTTRLLDDLRALAPVKEQLEVALDAHHVAVDDQLAPGAGANAQILSGGDMHLTVGSALENRFGDIKAGGSLVIDGTAVISNVGATLYRIHTFDGTWRTYGGQTVSYQRPTISESIGSIAGVIEGRQGVSITGRSFSNIDITAGTVGNIQDAVNVIGSGLSGASSAGAQLAAAARDDGNAGLQVTVGNRSNAGAGAKVAAGAGDAGVFGTFVSATRGVDGKVGTDVQAAAGIGGAAGTRAEADGGMSGTQAVAGAGLQRSTSTLLSAGTRADGTVDVRAVASGAADVAGIARLSGSATDTGLGLGGAIASTGSGSGLGAALHAAASGVSNRLLAGEEVASGTATAIDLINGVALNGAQQQSGTVNDGRLGGMVAATRNDTRLGNVLMTGTPSASQQVGSVQNAALGSAVKVNPSGLFLRNPDANGNYLFETRPQFANQQQWTSSDYLLKQLAFDPATTQKRLGDGFYEQRLVREQLAELTGHTLYDGANDDSTYKELLTNAVSAAREFGLRPGVALSADQVSRLTSDIVWMESQTVMLADGSTETVLVPKVYLAHVGEHVLQPGGALVTGNGVTINTTESIVNTGGVIDGGNGRTLLVAAQDIVNQGGSIKGDSVALVAGRDVRNESLAVTEAYDFGQNSGSYTSLSNQATITATGSLDIMAGRDLSDLAGQFSGGSANLTAGQNISFGTIKTGSTYQSQISGYTEKDSSITHQLSQISTTGDLKVAATGDLKLNGTQVTIGTAGSGTGQLLAGGTIDVAAVTNEVNTSVQNDPRSKQYDKQVHENQTVVGAGVTATGSLMVGAGLIETGAINVTGSSLVAGEALKLTATDSVNIVSTQEQHLSDTALTRTSSSFMKSKTTQQVDYVASSQAVGSSISGKTVEVSAGKDINVLGSAIAGDGDVSLTAVGSVNIGAATGTLTEQHHTQVKESGFLSGDGFGISYGTRTTTTDQSRDATTQSGQSRSMVGSLGGNLGIVAGDAIKVSGSDLAAGLNMNLDGRSVTIDPGQDNLKGKFEQTKVQDGLMLAVGGSVVNAIQTFQSLSSAASQSKDTRVQALAAATAAMAAKNVANDIAQNGINVSLSLTVGHSESQYTQTTSNLLNSGSVLNAGNDITIRATGGGKDSNVSVIGSDLHATGNIMLKADNQVNLLAAQDLESQHSDSKSLSAAAGIGASIGTNGMSYGLTANASVGRGTVDGDGTTQANTHVAAGDLLTITSGGDTNLKGAVASGSQVVADVKGNLNIESLQDKATFDSKDQSVSVGGTVGVGASFSGSVNQNKAHNDYASVQEQSGIRAGDGGFQVTVGGNTDLKGGVISSSTAGTSASSLVTATLTHSDIANYSTASASGIGMGGGFTVAGSGANATGNEDGGIKLMNMGISGAGVSLPSVNAVSNNATGVARSGIGARGLVITDDVAQRERTGQGVMQATVGINRDIVTGDDTSRSTANNFNPGAMQAELSVTSAFTVAAAPIAANAIGDIGKAKQDAAQREADQYKTLSEYAAKHGNDQAAQFYKAEETEYQAISNAWGENGIDRLLLHVGTQGLIGGLTGGSAGTLNSVSGVIGGSLGQQIGKSLGEAAADQQGLLGKVRDDFINTYQNSGATVGGTLAGLAAASTAGSGGVNVLMGAAQAANTSNTVDAFNRQLHLDEKSIAAKLAARSSGKYTATQIEAAMRATGSNKYGEDVTAGMVVPLTAATTANELYDTTGMVMTNDGSGHAFLVQQIQTQVDPELAIYIRNNTGGSNSPYTWEPSVLGEKPTATPVAAQNPFTANSAGCVTAECAAGVGPSFNHDAGAIRVLGGLQAVAGGTQALGGGTLVGIGGASCLETLGLGCVVAAVGAFQILGGLDNVYTGTNTAVGAPSHMTIGGELILQTGLSPGASELIYGGLQLGTGYGAIKLSNLANDVRAAESIETATRTDTYVTNNFYRDGEISPQSLATSSGVTIRAIPEKTTTVLGTWLDDTDKIINQQLGYPKTLNYEGPKKGGFNLLNTPDELYESLGPDKFWKEVNEPFLKAAVDRGDELYLATRPTPAAIERVSSSDGLSGFGREYYYLVKKGYVYDPKTGKMCLGGCKK